MVLDLSMLYFTLSKQISSYTYLRTLLLPLFRASLLCGRSLDCRLIFTTSQHLTHIKEVACFVAFIDNPSKLLVYLIGRGNFVFGRSIKAINSSR
jgi:hypothetical protein